MEPLAGILIAKSTYLCFVADGRTCTIAINCKNLWHANMQENRITAIKQTLCVSRRLYPIYFSGV